MGNGDPSVCISTSPLGHSLSVLKNGRFGKERREVNIGVRLHHHAKADLGNQERVRNVHARAEEEMTFCCSYFFTFTS